MIDSKGHACGKIDRQRKKNLGTLAVPRFSIWQRVKDSNPHIQSQSLLCYLYTNPLCLFTCVANRYYYSEKRIFVKGFHEFFSFFSSEFSSASASLVSVTPSGRAAAYVSRKECACPWVLKPGNVSN